MVDFISDGTADPSGSRSSLGLVNWLELNLFFFFKLNRSVRKLFHSPVKEGMNSRRFRT